ncbi:MAG TPA: hypothetical protein DCL60_01735, partial [Armatimonadetes bacterium]|nr:hypothetical protein [Armatimonadota bacterium]
MKIKDGIYWIGTLNPTLRTFDVIMNTEYGTTYNSYLITDEKTVIIDAGARKFTDLYLEKVKSATDPAKVDYIVVQHSEPDHTGALQYLLELCPNAQVLCSKPAAKWLGEIMNRDFNVRTVEDGEEVSIGRGTLCFRLIPFWHWPDTLCTYV